MRIARINDFEQNPEPFAECLIVLGASAGGPSALCRILQDLPSGFLASLVIVQHMDEQFAPALANWLDRQVPLRVRLALGGERPRPGSVLIAGLNRHIVLSRGGYLAYSEQPASSAYRPSIDAFFHSVNRCWPTRVIGVLLTGMGKDGAAGLKALRQSGHYTICQDQASSAVYGMPKAAAELDAAEEILPLNEIGPRLRMLASTPALHA